MKPSDVTGRSLTSLLKNPDAEWKTTAITAYGDRYITIRDERFRYIRYRDDQEELYDHSKDPHEWTNQIKNKDYASELEALKVSAAEKDAKLAELTAALEVAAKEVEGFKAMVAELEASKVNASKEAAKIVASVGVSPVELSPADSKPSAEAVDHLATFLSLPVGSKERNEYFAAHKNAIIKAAI